MTREEKIKQLNDTYKVDKEDYLRRLETKFFKNGIVKCFKDQFFKEYGKDFYTKFFSATSTSRFCFEVFSNYANYDIVKDIEFEYRLPQLRTRSGLEDKQPNIDVYIDEGSWIEFIEIGFTEIVNNKDMKLSKDYFNYEVDDCGNISENDLENVKIRFCGNVIFAKHFIKFVKEILKYERIDEYDWFDLKRDIIHIFGIGQYIYKIRPTANICFWSMHVFFDGYKVSKLADIFSELVDVMMNEYINELGLEIRFGYILDKFNLYRFVSKERIAFASNKTVYEMMLEQFKIDE